MLILIFSSTRSNVFCNGLSALIVIPEFTVSVPSDVNVLNLPTAGVVTPTVVLSIVPASISAVVATSEVNDVTPDELTVKS